MSNKTAYRNGGKTSEEGLYRPLSHEYSKEGVLRDSHLLVTQNGTPNNTVLISIGDVIIGNNSPITGESDYFYHSWVVAPDSVTITNNVSGNPRVDSIVGYINLATIDIINNDNPAVLTCVAVPGTPAASPVAPVDATIQAAIGAGNPWVLLAQVAVANGFSSIVTGNITDCRPRAASLPRFIDNFADFVARGSVPATSANLTTVLPALEAFIGGLQVSKPPLSHLFTATKDTYVDISATATTTIADDYAYTAVANGAGAPSISAGYIRLYKVVTSGSAITSVVDLRNTTATVIPDGFITGNQLATSAITLGYTSITTPFTSTTINAYTDVTSLSVTVNIPTGGRRVEISVGGQYLSTTAAAGANIELVCTDVTAGAIIGGLLVNNFGAFFATPCNFIASHVPSAGTRTYKVQFQSNIAGTFKLSATSVVPAYILVKLI